MMKKRLLALLLSLCLLLALVPTTALAAGSLPFRDVSTSDWFYRDVQYVYENSLMAGISKPGTSEQSFDPNGTTTRGMIVSILYRLEGRPDVTGSNSFRDVDPNMYYATAITWASQNKIVSGYSSSKFGPNDFISREQMASILYRYSSYKDYDVSSYANLTAFPDASKVSDWAWSQLSWANAMKLITGTGNGQLAPQDSASRAQVASILARFCRNIAFPETDHTVTFDLNYPGAAAPQTVTVQPGQVVAAPAAPARSGYTFDGWYTAAEGGERFAFGNAISEDITLYAHWTETASHTVVFNLNYPGAAAPQTVTVQPGQVVAAPAAPARSGYTFDGWYTAAEGGERFAFGNAISEDITLYAHWTENAQPASYTVLFDQNYLGAPAPQAVTVQPGQTVPSPAIPNRGGYIFDGWYTAAEGGERFSFDTAIMEDITLYAHWTVAPPSSYTVTFDLNYTGGETITPASVEPGQTVSAPQDPVRSGYIFDGWYTAAEGGERFSFDTAIMEDITLYAHWVEAETCTVSFDLNYPGSGVYKQEEVIAGQLCPQPHDPGRGDYLFDGWYTAAENGSRFDFSAPVTEDITLYAHWVYNGIEYAKPYQCTGSVTLYENTPLVNFKMMGKEYGQGITFAADYDSGKGEALYTLDGEYDLMTFDVGSIDYSKTDKVTLRIYADGTLADSIACTWNMPTQHYSLNVKGVTQLRIAREGGTRYGYGLANTMLYTAENVADEGLTVPEKSSSEIVKDTDITDKGLVQPYQIYGSVGKYLDDPLEPFTMMGIEYAKGITFHSDYDSGHGEADFNLGGSYDLISFDVGSIDYSKTDKVILRIYKDDEPVDAIECKWNMPTQHYILNVQDTNQLRIVRENGTRYGYGLADITLYTAEDVTNQGLTVPTLSSLETVKNTNITDKELVQPYQTYGSVDKYLGDLLKPFTMMGIEYAKGITFHSDYDSGHGEADFNLGGSYDLISFDVGSIDYSKTDKVILRIYKDDEPVDAIECKWNMPTQHYILNVQDTNQLRIVRENGTRYGYGLADITLYTAEDVENQGLTVPELSTLETVRSTNLAAGDVLPYQTYGSVGQYKGDPLTTFSMMGTEYKKGITFHADYDSGHGEANFNLGGSFTTFSATIGHIDNARGDAVTLRVYADDELVESIELTSNMSNLSYSRDVTDVNQLRIVREGGTRYGYGLANTTLS